MIRHGLTEIVNWLPAPASSFMVIPQSGEGPGVLDPDIAAFAADQDETFGQAFSARPIAEQRSLYEASGGAITRRGPSASKPRISRFST